MMVILLVLAAAIGLAAAAYAGLGWRQQWLPLSLRALAWTALGLLLVNPGCPLAGVPGRPLVLLDASLSMTAAGGRWRAALDSARLWGEVRPFGDAGRQLDTVPDAGSSRLAEALEAARATGRPVVVVTDGEIEDAAILPASGRPTVRLFPRDPAPAVAVSRVESPARITARDTLRLRASVRAVGLGARRLPLALSVDGREVARASADLGGDGETEVSFLLPPGRMPVGDRVLQVAVADSVDAEPRDNRRSRLLTVTAVPGVVLLAAPADWDARFLVGTVRGVTDLPVEGYVRLERNTWRRMADLAPVTEALVRDAAARADLLVLRGQGSGITPGRGQSVLEWPASGGSGDGDWYLSAGSGGPVPGSLAGFSLDSLPPALAVGALLDGETPDWVGLTGQLGRRGTPRPVVAGFDGPGGRRVRFLADGLWRWAFRGGASEQAYRAMVAAVVDWLLAARGATGGVAGPVHSVVPRGRPVVFARAAGDTVPALPVRLQPDGSAGIIDTLRFGPDGQDALWLDPGTWRYTLEGGGGGRVVVEDWSAEWFPGPITLQGQEVPAPRDEATRGLRELWWLYALGVLALCGEWVVRRRRGLR